MPSLKNCDKNLSLSAPKQGVVLLKILKIKKAWQLIDGASCRGLAIGDAQISIKHCNFVINTNKATGQDIIELINLVKERVLKNIVSIWKKK